MWSPRSVVTAIAFAACWQIVASPSALAQFSSFDVPGASDTSAFSINNPGQIVGGYSLTSDGPDHGFLLDLDGSFTTIDFPGALETDVYGINDSGLMVGAYSDSDGNTHGFQFDGTTFSPIDIPGAVGTLVTSINNNGEMVGFYWESDDAPDRGLFLDSFGNFSTVDFPGQPQTDLNGLNDSDQITGVSFPDTLNFSGFLLNYSDGSSVPINFPGARSTQVQGLDNSADMVGYYYVTGSTLAHGYLVTGAGTTYVGFDLDGARQTYGGDINDNSQIVGSYQDDSRSFHGFVGFPSAGMKPSGATAAEDPAVPELTPPGYQLRHHRRR